MPLELSEKERSDFLTQARHELVQELITNSGALTKLSPAQAGGYLDVTQNTLSGLKIDVIDVTGTGSSLRYDLADLKAYEENQKRKRTVKSAATRN